MQGTTYIVSASHAISLLLGGLVGLPVDTRGTMRRARLLALEAAMYLRGRELNPGLTRDRRKY